MSVPHLSRALAPSDPASPDLASLRFTPLADAPVDALEELLDTAFGPDRHGRTAYRLREKACPIADLSFAVFAETDGNPLVACLQSWPIALVSTAKQDPLILVGPVAVAPSAQSCGLGSRLMVRLIGALDKGGAAPQMLIGDPGFYGRFGFTAADTGGWALPGPVERHRLLARGASGLPRIGTVAPYGGPSFSLDPSAPYR